MDVLRGKWAVGAAAVIRVFHGHKVRTVKVAAGAASIRVIYEEGGRTQTKDVAPRTSIVVESMYVDIQGQGTDTSGKFLVVM